MPASRLIVLGVAAVAAGGAGFVAKNMVAPPPAKVVVAPGPQAPAIPTQEVAVLTGDVAMGDPLGNKVEWKPWPRDAVNSGFITRSDDPEALAKLKGSVARMAMYGGEPVRRVKLIDEGQSFMSSMLPAGTRAVATSIAADTSAGGFILPNDFVDVIMTRRSDTAGGGGFSTETILKNIRVLAIDQTIQEDEEGKKTRVGQTATLELTPEQAEIITVAQQMADRLTLALRSIKDTQEKNLDQADYLVSGAGRRGTVKLIKFGEISEVGARK